MIKKPADRRPGFSRGPRVLIVEDHPILRRGLKDILAAAHPRAVIGEAGDSRTACETLRRKTWDVMLLDLNLPGRGGLELLEDARQLAPETRVLVVSVYPEEEFAVRAFKLGAAGYLMKTRTPEELVQALDTILEGRTYVSPGLAERLAAALGEKAAGRCPADVLSIRELQVLRLIAKGQTIKNIAAELALSEKTIATYRARLAEKTRLASNVQLTRYAFQHGLDA